MEYEAFLPLQNRLNHTPARSSRPVRLQFRRLFACVFVLKLLTQFIFALLELPFVRLVESAVCRNFLNTDEHYIHEAQCKSKAVQDTTAQIVGYKTTFDALPCGFDLVQYADYD
jgi:hypothetical protein